MTKQIDFNSPEVQAVKVKWDEVQKKFEEKYNINYAGLFEHFQDETKNANTISKIIGVSREYIRQIYNLWFRDIFGNESFRERRRLLWLKKNRERENIEFYEGVLIDPRIVLLLEIAEKKGYKFDAVVGIKNHSERIIKIDGVDCSFRFLTSSHVTYGNNYYYNFSATAENLSKVGFLIIHTSSEEFPEQVFVIPSLKLIEAFFSEKIVKKRKWIYIPSRIDFYKNKRKPRIDWFKDYKDAWHLLTKSANNNQIVAAS